MWVQSQTKVSPIAHEIANKKSGYEFRYKPGEKAQFDMSPKISIELSK